MEYTVLIQPKRGGFSATIPGLPECRAHGKSEKEVLDKISARAQKLLTNAKLVTINLPENGHKKNDPWLAMAGKWANDPTFDDFQKIVEKFRKRPKPKKRRG